MWSCHMVVYFETKKTGWAGEDEGVWETTRTSDDEATRPALEHILSSRDKMEPQARVDVVS